MGDGVVILCRVSRACLCAILSSCGLKSPITGPCLEGFLDRFILVLMSLPGDTISAYPLLVGSLRGFLLKLVFIPCPRPPLRCPE